MKRFIVNSSIPLSAQPDVIGWVKGLSSMLQNAKIENVKFKTAYCCTPDACVIAEFEGPDKETVSGALGKINVPFTAIMETTKV
jgi:hypothetical protein